MFFCLKLNLEFQAVGKKEKENKLRMKTRLITRKDQEQHQLNRITMKEYYCLSRVKTALYKEKRNYL